MHRIPISALIAFCLVASAHGAEFRFANWNIQTLVHSADPKSVFPDDYRRQQADFADLKRWRDLVSADVFFLQEVTSPAAIDEVFPASEGWAHCISGQYSLLEGAGLPVPTCVDAGSPPTLPQAGERQQFVGVAVRSESGIAIVATTDLQSLNVKSDDNGEIRDVRWGLDVELANGDDHLRVLVVHLKSGCFDDRIDFRLFTRDPSLSAPAKFACDTLGRQMFPLHAWISDREAAGDAWMVVGDFNRRLDLGGGTAQDEVWQALTAYSPNFEGVDRDPRADVLIIRSPYKEPSNCWLEKRNPNPGQLADQDGYFFAPIEFFLYGTDAGAMVEPATAAQVPWPNALPDDDARLSDHCPSALSLRLEGGAALVP